MANEYHQRPSLDLAERFLEETDDEAPGLAKRLRRLDEEGMRNLAGILSRFDRGKRGQLGATERLFARRVLSRLRKPSTEGLALTNKILDYLDLNANAKMEDDELELCVEVLEMFARADSVNDTLSEFELQMLYAVLRHLDKNHNYFLDARERDELRIGLNDPKAFLESQKRTNPLLKEILETR